MKENHLSGDEYFENLCPLASYVYWYALGREREDVCLWALETAKTIDGLILGMETGASEKACGKPGSPG